MNPYLLGAIVAVGIWGGSGVYRGAKWTASHIGCIAKHGVRGCKAKPAVVPVVAK